MRLRLALIVKHENFPIAPWDGGVREGGLGWEAALTYINFLINPYRLGSESTTEIALHFANERYFVRRIISGKGRI